MSVEFRGEGPVAVVTIDRPEIANAIDRPTAAAPSRSRACEACQGSVSAF